MAQITEIGIVKSKFTEFADPFVMRKEESLITVYDRYAEGLYDIEVNRYLQILFHFHRSSEFKLRGQWYYGGEKGVFACRSPKRPGAIGLTTVELLEHDGNTLRVRGLDALNGTPVFDIKPYIAAIEPARQHEVKEDFVLHHPRAEIITAIRTYDMRRLLTDAGMLHGHYCPGLAQGVAASVYGLHALADLLGITVPTLQHAGGMEELIAVIEINSCFADGVQFVSGCTLGNNGLIFRDYGKTALTFCRRDGRGVRVVAEPRIRNMIEDIEPRFYPAFDKVVVEHTRDPKILRDFKTYARTVSFHLIDLPKEKLVSIKEVRVTLPEYAPIQESVVCKGCGETVMAGKTVMGSDDLCKECAESTYDILDGTGIHKEERR